MFKLFVNGYERAEFKSHYQDISISGFDIKNQKKVDIKIQVIPKNNSYSIKESKTCVCHIYIQYRIHIFVF
jgi:uncharacterized membrane protein